MASASQRHFSEDSHWSEWVPFHRLVLSPPDGVWCSVYFTGSTNRYECQDTITGTGFTRAVSSTSSSTASHPHLSDRTHPEVRTC